MYKDFKAHLVNEIENTKKAGLYKSERIILSASILLSKKLDNSDPSCPSDPIISILLIMGYNY